MKNCIDIILHYDFPQSLSSWKDLSVVLENNLERDSHLDPF
jgi:hypothetical protein